MAQRVKWPAPIQARRGEAATDEVLFWISGLTCAECAAQFEYTVRGLEGIKSAHLNFAAGTLAVRGLFHPREIIRHAKRAGYRATVVDRVGKHPYGPLLKDAGPIWYLALAAFVFAGGFTVAVLGLTWPQLFLEYLPPSVTLETTLFALSTFLGGYHTLKRALHGLRHRRLDASFLAVLIVTGALVIGEWLQAAAVISLFALRELILAHSLEGARRYVRAAWTSLPDDAMLAVPKDDGAVDTDVNRAALAAQEPAATAGADQDGLQENDPAVAAGSDQPLAADQGKATPIDRIAPGDVCVVGPGQQAPVDGIILQGGAVLTEPPLSGAETLVAKREGDLVYAGSSVDEGAIHVRAEVSAAESALARALRLVEKAQGTPFRSLNWVARASTLISSVAMVAALATALVPPLLFGRAVAPWLEAALVLLAIAFPCVLAVNTPAMVSSAVVAAARHGVLVKSGDAFERLARVNAVAYEKSGAFTDTRLKVTDVYPLDGWNMQEVLAICAGLAWGVDDPVAGALVQAAIETEAGMVTAESSEVGESGSVEGIVGGERYAVGSLAAMERRGVALTQVLAMIAALEKDGKVVALVAHGQAPIAVAALSETVIDESRRALRRLRRMAGIDTLVMLTEENEQVAAAAAGELKADEYRAGLRSDQKVNEIKQLQRQGKRVAMIGRHREDGAALAVADVGVSIGPLGAADTLGKADVLVVGDHFGKLPHARALARRALAVGWQNVVMTVLVKLTAVVLLVLGHLTLWQAAVADFLTAAIVALGIARVFRKVSLPNVREPARRTS